MSETTLRVGGAFRLKRGVKAVNVRGDREYTDRHVHILAHCQHLTEDDERLGQLWVYPACNRWGCSERIEDVEAVSPDMSCTLCPDCLAEVMGDE